MVDWTASMEQTYEFYEVDPNTWGDKKLIEVATSCNIDRDLTSLTLGSASINCTGTLNECYIRVYLITIQNGVKDKHPLGTFLVQTPSESFDGTVSTVSVDAYTPLIELKESPPPLGYSVLKGQNIMELASGLTSDYARAPVTLARSDKTLSGNFVANTDDTWLSFLTDFIAQAKFKYDLDEMGRILFAPEQDTASLQPVWTYTDDNSSILLPDITVDRDLYGVPNVVEVVYSSDDNFFYSVVTNDDDNSPISIKNRGRRIVHRETNPSFSGEPTQQLIDEYAEQLLRNLSSLEYTISYSHGYCPVRIGDCVLLNYESAGLKNIKAKVIRQSIECVTGCTVSETAVFTTKLWG